ncbi:penicillin-binding protein 2 [Candidatus Nomurabacteria bacterium]|nr:penicillin-binding protein 2 [Candidatus Nomurabacteria bacterium]
MKDDPFKIKEGLVRDSKLKGFSRTRNSGDYLDFWSKATGSLGRFLTDSKVNLLFLVLILFLSILWSRSFYLQVIKGNDFLNIAEGNRIREEVIKSNRGLVYDRFGNLLLKNVSHFFLYLDQKNLPEEPEEQEELFKKIKDILEIDQETLQERLKHKENKILLYENIPYQKAIKLILLAEDNLALEVNFEPRRQYFSDLGLSHVLGYLGSVTENDLDNDKNYRYTDRIGKTGLELIYEDTLRGIDGIREIEVDALNRAKNIIAWHEPLDGHDLVLTIDAAAQAKLYEVMNKNAEAFDKTKMAAVVLDPKDGGVLSMVSLPDFDNNIFTSALDQEQYNNIITDSRNPLLNRVISGTYPFGSVFKPVVAAAALEEKIIDANFTVNSTGGVQIGNNFFPDWRPQGHGRTDIKWALADSVNTFFYTVGGGNNQWLQEGLGINKIMDYSRLFGLGQATGIDLNSEAFGFLPSKEWKEEALGERWYLGDTYNLSIGQGYLLGTPLQAAMIMSYFATGQVFKPHFIKETKINDQVEVFKPEVLLDNLISDQNFKTIRAGLRETVLEGTAQSLQSVKVAVAGKTGTAQFNKNKTPHSWFAAFAPYDDPQIVILVLVEEGGDRGLAVTVARQFLEWYFDR